MAERTKEDQLAEVIAGFRPASEGAEKKIENHPSSGLNRAVQFLKRSHTTNSTRGDSNRSSVAGSPFIDRLLAISQERGGDLLKKAVANVDWQASKKAYHEVAESDTQQPEFETGDFLHWTATLRAKTDVVDYQWQREGESTYLRLKPNALKDEQHKQIFDGCEVIAVDDTDVSDMSKLGQVDHNSSLRLAPPKGCNFESLVWQLMRPNKPREDSRAIVIQDVLFLSIPPRDQIQAEKDGVQHPDTIYQYSVSNETSQAAIIPKLAGAFITLTHQYRYNITEDEPTLSVVTVGDIDVNVVYIPVTSRFMLMIALSAAVLPEQQLHNSALAASKTLAAWHGPLDQIFLDINCRPQVDTFFDIYFDSINNPFPLSPGALLHESLEHPKGLLLPPKLRTEIGDVLTGVHTKGANLQLDRPEASLVIGSALYYRGQVVVSRMTAQQLEEMTQCCRHFGFTRSTNAPPLTLWHQVHGIDFRASGGSRSHILITRNQDLMLCVLLRSIGEAHGPDMSQIVHCETSLNILNSNDVGPKIADYLDRVTSRSDHANDTTQNTSSASSGVNDSVTKAKKRGLRRLMTLSRSNKHKSHTQVPEQPLTYLLQNQISAGKENALLTHVYFSTHSGVVIKAGTEDDLHTRENPEILVNFHAACLQIQSVIREQYFRASKFQNCYKLGDVYEHGIMFQTKPAANEGESSRGKPPKRPSTTTANDEASTGYWVVGRVMGSTGLKQAQEMYVCFREGTSQNVIEIAFRVQFGMADAP